MTLWLIPESGSGKRLRLIDRSFRPSFYVHGPEPRLRQIARALAARAQVTCTLTRREDIWEGRELLVLRIALDHPTQFAALARFVSRFDPGLRLYNSDLMLPPMYCWEKNVFPLAKVEVETGTRDWGLGARAEKTGAGDWELGTGTRKHPAPRTQYPEPKT
ncbi:MAG: hypothetical protein ACREB3_01665, partial [Burkholderiales bacterium]